MSFPVTVSRCRRAPVISLVSTFLATGAVLNDVETMEFSFFNNCGEIVIFDGVFVQRNVSHICQFLRAALQHYTSSY
jgi:hypothetical protein